MTPTQHHFPPGFLWGTASASHQVEGGNTNNNWSAWEDTPGKIIHGDRSGLACDWWGGRWQEDFDRAAETGQNSHRLSLEWSRIQPAPDAWDEDALAYYREIIRGLIARKMTPFVTLHHFTDPLWLSERGGWENPQTPQAFAAYVRKVVTALKDDVSTWVTLNEPTLYAYNGYLMDGTTFPPGKNDMELMVQVVANLIRGHAAAYHIIHEIQPQAQVGAAFHIRRLVPAHPANPLDRTAADLVSSSFNASFPNALKTGKLSLLFKNVAIPEAARTQDYIGINYYTTDRVSFDLFKPGEMFVKRAFAPEWEPSEGAFIANYPQGLFDTLQWANSFHLPIYITENGINDSSGHLRSRYLVEHLYQTWRACQLNLPIRGYFHWSLLDNFEWERGWTQRFGLWGLDTATQERIRRPGVDVYADICKNNAITRATVEQYTPSLTEKVFKA